MICRWWRVSTCLIIPKWFISSRCTYCPYLKVLDLVMSTHISCCMNIQKKAELTTSICFIDRFLELKIPIYSSEMPEKWWRGTRLWRREEAIRKLYDLKTNAIRARLPVFSFKFCEIFLNVFLMKTSEQQPSYLWNKSKERAQWTWNP